MSARDGGPAFPCVLENITERNVTSPVTGEIIPPGRVFQCAGLSVRDYFAAKALQGLLANPKLRDEILKQGGCDSGWIEQSAWAFADAMLVAREAKP